MSCLCLSVKSDFSSGASVRPENAVTHSVGNEGKKFVGSSLKLLCFRTMALLALYGYRKVGRFLSAEYARKLAFIRAIPTSLAWPDVPGKGTSGHYCPHSVDYAGMLACPQIVHLRVEGV